MVQFLIANGADVALTDADGMSPIHLCNQEVLLIFMQAVLELQLQENERITVFNKVATMCLV